MLLTTTKELDFFRDGLQRYVSLAIRTKTFLVILIRKSLKNLWAKLRIRRVSKSGCKDNELNSTSQIHCIFLFLKFCKERLFFRTFFFQKADAKIGCL